MRQKKKQFLGPTPKDSGQSPQDMPFDADYKYTAKLVVKLEVVAESREIRLCLCIVSKLDAVMLCLSFLTRHGASSARSSKRDRTAMNSVVFGLETI